jgi:myxalamid-type polyketide synthase MxaE and MxaD
LREPFQFGATLQQLLQKESCHFVEVSPHPVLSSAILENLTHSKKSGTVVPSLRRQEKEWETIQSSLGTLYTLGYEPAWERLYEGKGQLVSLPLYPWQRQRFWFDQLLGDMEDRKRGTEPQARRHREGSHPLLGEHLALSTPPGQHVWETYLDSPSLSYLDDHRVGNVAILPGAAYVEMALAAASQILTDHACAVTEIKFKQALFLSREVIPNVQVTLTPQTTDQMAFQVTSQPIDNKEGSWTVHATGTIHYNESIQLNEQEQTPVAQLQALLPNTLSTTAHYDYMAQQGLHYGPSFQTVQEIWHGKGQALGRVQLSPRLSSTNSLYRLHPTLLDAGFQIVTATVDTSENGRAPTKSYLPVGIDQMQLHQTPGDSIWCYTRLRPDDQPDADDIKADIYLINEQGEAIATVLGLRLQNIDASQQPAQSDLNQWLYETNWQLKELAPPRDEDQPTKTGVWLLFTDQDGVGETLAEQLRQANQECVTVVPGETYQRLTAEHYQLNPQQPEDFQQLLLAACPPDGVPCRGVIHLWSLDQATPDTPMLTSLARAEAKEGQTTIHLIQALSQSQLKEFPRLWLVTRGSQPVTADVTRSGLPSSMLWGMGRVIAMEHPELHVVMVDLDPEKPETETGQLWQTLWQSQGENQIALRGENTYTARLNRLYQPKTAQHSLPFRADGSYLVTGGLSGLGLATAEWMVKQGVRRLILMGRSALPSRNTWNELSAKHPLQPKITAIKALEAQGASIHLASVDVGDEAQLTAFLQSYKQEGWPAIRGVVHSAGLTRDKLLIQMDKTTFNAPLQPKVYGAWLLHNLLADAPLDFFVLYSSASSVLGMYGQANYAAGNAFLDALTYYRQRLGLPALSINWGSWSEIGIGARANISEQLAQHGMGEIAPEKGLKILERLLLQTPPQAAVLPIDWRVWRKSGNPLLTTFETVVPPAEATEQASIESYQLVQDLLLLGTQAERKQFIESHLHELMARIMRLEPAELDPRQPLNVLGIDSIMAVELRNKIEEGFGINLSVVDLLRGSNLSDVADQTLSHLHMQDDDEIADLLAEIEQLSPEEVEMLLMDNN